MIDAFSTAVGDALTTYVTDVTSAVGDNLPIVLAVSLGLIGLALVWRTVRKFAGGR